MARAEHGRPGYHHGDLRAALVEAGLALARRGGMAEIGLREVTRAVGVSPNAAYRHFDGHAGLVLAVARAAEDQLARTITSWADDRAADATPAERAVHRVRAIGRGYIHFAATEPGWFALAVSATEAGGAAGTAVTVGGEVPAPYRMLLEALDALVETGVLPPARRPHAEWVCWSAVHGFAHLASHGPLAGQDPDVVESLAEHVVNRVVDGL